MTLVKKINEAKIWLNYTLTSPVYDYLMILDEPSNIRNDLIRRLDIESGAKIIECAAGTGRNIKYYPEDIELYLVDSNRSMLSYAKRKAKKSKIRNITIEKRYVRQLNYQDDYFDIGVLTYALSAIVDNEIALDEIARVVKPGGQVGVLDFNCAPIGIAFAPIYLNALLRQNKYLEIEFELGVPKNQSIYFLRKK